MNVQVLGVGCAKCKNLEERIRQLVATHHLDVEVEKVTEIQEIMKFGVMMTPGLVIDGKVKSSGSVPKDEQLLAWLKGENQ
jgi:small redox-active disulfide protein 2